MAVRRLGVAMIAVGFVALVAAAFVLAGGGVALAVAGVEFVVGGYVVVFVEARLEASRTVRS